MGLIRGGGRAYKIKVDIKRNYQKGSRGCQFEDLW